MPVLPRAGSRFRVRLPAAPLICGNKIPIINRSYPVLTAPKPPLSLLLSILLAAAPCAPDGPGSVLRCSETVTAGGTSVEVIFAPGDADVARQVRGVLPAALQEATRWGALPASVTLAVHATHAELEAATGRAGAPWMRAWARPGKVDLQSPATWTRGFASDAALTQILTHELSHCVLFHAAGPEGTRRIPTWFQEGMASVSAGERHAVADGAALREAGPGRRGDPRRFYGTADRAFRLLLERFGEPRLRSLLHRLGDGIPFASAFEDALGLPVAEFEGDVSRRLDAVAVGG